MADAARGERGTEDNVDVFEFGTGERVTGAFSTLDGTDEGMATKIRTRGNQGHALTLWYVIFNAPENCSDGVCGEDDVSYRQGRKRRNAR